MHMKSAEKKLEALAAFGYDVSERRPAHICLLITSASVLTA